MGIPPNLGRKRLNLVARQVVELLPLDWEQVLSGDSENRSGSALSPRAGLGYTCDPKIVANNPEFCLALTLMKRLAVGILLSILALSIFAAAPDYAATIANLIDPAKLATLGDRGANPRVQKAVYWLHTAKTHGNNPALILDLAVSKAGYTNKLAAELTKEALLRNIKIADALGCFDAEGLEEMRRGKSPTVTKGPYRGDQLSVDHIIPRAVVPELDNVIANLELMPLKLNMKKNASMGDRQRDTARKLAHADLLGSQGLSRVLALTKQRREELSLTR